MSVSKRVRYEVLRRDQHTCRYCGGTAPDVTLTVDHVTPVALGGSDDPTNLVAACKDCNAGKTSTTPGAPLVADVAADALRWAQAMQRALNDLGVTQENLNAYREMFLDEWDRYKGRWNGAPHPLPAGWETTLHRWANLGVPINVIEASISVPMGKPSVTSSDKFRYFCGVVWRRVDDVRRAVERELSGDAPVPGYCVHCGADECRVKDIVPDTCIRCGDPSCGFPHGQDEGWQDGFQHAMDQLSYRDFPHRLIEGVVDGGPASWMTELRWVP